MSHVFPRHAGPPPPTVERGDGVYLYDRDGKEYFDGSGGAAVSCLGHSDPDVISAIKDQVDKVAFAHTGFFTSDAAEQLADLLIEVAPASLDRVYFVSGGSEAVEAALKLARQYFLETGEPQRHRVIARRQSYHGNTLGALATGGNMWRREPFSPMMIETSHISPCYAYRDCHPDESAADYGRRVADELESEILRLGAENVMAFVAEPVVGATMGAVTPVAGYFERIRDICSRHGVLLILDDVMCGMGRTGTVFASEQEGVDPDIAVVAKGLGAGYQPIGAMMCSGKIYRAVAEGSGFFQHGHTYVGHPTACAAALAVLKKVSEPAMMQQVRSRGKQLRDALQDAFGQHPHVGDIRGRGLFLGIEIVEDRDSKAPFPAERGIHKLLKRAAFDAGLICYPMGGTIDGKRGDHILLAPPFIMEDRHVDEIAGKLVTAFQGAF